MNKMDEPKCFIKISDGGRHYIDTVENAKKVIDQMAADSCEDEPHYFEFSTIYMTQKQFEELPEFEGF